MLDSVDADVVIGFGGYVALPAYLAAGAADACRSSSTRPMPAPDSPTGSGARIGQRVLGGGAGCRPARAEVVGVPVRPAITGLDRAALRAEARAQFGFADDARVLLVFGGSQGAVAINRAVLRRGARLRPTGDRGAARARPEEHPRAARAAAAAIRRTSRCRT